MRRLHITSVTFSFLLVFLTLLFSTQSYSATGILDGRTFIGLSGEMLDNSKTKEELQFNNGELFSVQCAQWDFSAANYTAKKDGDTITFSATTTSPKGGQIKWQGTIQGNTINATFTWTKERWWWTDAKIAYWFKGELKDI